MRGSYRPHSLLAIAPLVALFVRDRIARWRGAADISIPPYDADDAEADAYAHALRTRPAPDGEPVGYATTSSVVIQA